MNKHTQALNELFDRVPRRHTADNVKEINNITDEYEDLLTSLESEPAFEKKVAPFFDALDSIRATIKKSNDNKASKKGKDDLFDEASVMLKDGMEELKALIG